MHFITINLILPGVIRGRVSISSDLIIDLLRPTIQTPSPQVTKCVPKILKVI